MTNQWVISRQTNTICLSLDVPPWRTLKLGISECSFIGQSQWLIFVLRADVPPRHTLNYYYGDYYASQQCLYLLTSAWTTFFDHLIASWKLQAYQLPLLSNAEIDLLYNSCQFVPEWLLLLLNLPCWSQFHLYFHCFLALCHSYLNFLFDEKL